MTVEDQLRAAGRAVSEQVRDLPRLDLATQQAARHAKARTSRRRLGAGGWLIPLAAAAAVVAVAATLVVVKSPSRAAHKTSAAPAVSRPAARASNPATADPEALPGYFVAISDLEIMAPQPAAGQSGPAKDPKPDSVIVGETLTGKRLATITPPKGGTFVGVTGAADDRTFVLDSVQIADGPGFLSATQARTWYLLRISPGATPATTLTRLSFPVPSAADIDGIALSPDGTKLAMLYQLATSDSFPYSGPFGLAIYSIATGAVLRSWSGANPSHGSLDYGSDVLPDSNSLLTWTSDGQRLAFAYRNSKSPTSSLYLREVLLAGAGNDLFKDSTVIAEIAASAATGKSKIWCGSLGIAGDGRTAVCSAQLPKSPPVGATLDALTRPAPWTGCAAPTDTAYPGFAEISLTGDRLARVLYQVKPVCMGAGSASVLWSSPSGDTVLGAVSYTDNPSMTEHSAVVLYRHGTVTTISWPGAVSLLLANETAF